MGVGASVVCADRLAFALPADQKLVAGLEMHCGRFPHKIPPRQEKKLVLSYLLNSLKSHAVIGSCISTRMEGLLL